MKTLFLAFLAGTAFTTSLELQAAPPENAATLAGGDQQALRHDYLYVGMSGPMHGDNKIAAVEIVPADNSLPNLASRSDAKYFDANIVSYKLGLGNPVIPVGAFGFLSVSSGISGDEDAASDGSGEQGTIGEDLPDQVALVPLPYTWLMLFSACCALFLRMRETRRS